MPQIDLKYGKSSIPLEYDEARFEVLEQFADSTPLSDVQLGERLDSPIDSPSLDEIVSPGETVLIAVPDATRQIACGQVVNLIVRRLIAAGTLPSDIRVIFATGIHRRVTESEKQAILTPFIAQRVKTLDHNPRDLAQIVNIGEISGGISVELNRAVVEHDHVIIIGGVTFHYFAGFTGGRKLICPGLASKKTISATHKLAFDCVLLSRCDGVGTGLLDGNAVHEAFIEATAKIEPAFAVNTIVDDAGRLTDLYCGDWVASHRAACNAYAASHTVRIEEKRDLVIASCGGYPFDINMIQAHKSLEAASQACRQGGTILLVAECGEGTGRDDFLDWFGASDSIALAKRLCERYQVNGQTAWSLLKKAEAHDIMVVTALSEDVVAKMRMNWVSTANGLAASLLPTRSGYIIPAGARTLITTNKLSA